MPRDITAGVRAFLEEKYGYYAYQYESYPQVALEVFQSVVEQFGLVLRYGKIDVRVLLPECFYCFGYGFFHVVHARIRLFYHGKDYRPASVVK